MKIYCYSIFGFEFRCKTIGLSIVWNLQIPYFHTTSLRKWRHIEIIYEYNNDTNHADINQIINNAAR